MFELAAQRAIEKDHSTVGFNEIKCHEGVEDEESLNCLEFRSLLKFVNLSRMKSVVEEVQQEYLYLSMAVQLIKSLQNSTQKDQCHQMILHLEPR